MSPQLLQYPKRSDLLLQLEQEIQACRVNHGHFALAVFNLRKFREININYGHQAGDVLLLQVAERIAKVLRPGDRLFHVGNDEFAVTLAQVRSEQVIELAMMKVLGAIGGNYDICDSVVAVTAMGGAVMFPDHAENRDEMLVGADAALCTAREQRLDYSVCDASCRERKHRAVDIETDLRKALDHNDLILYYQPQIDLQKGALSGCEVLARWNHSGQGWIRPDEFIPVAEKTGLIDTLTYWSINVALREWSQLCSKGLSGSISINLSAALLKSPEVVELVGRALNIWGTEPGSLVLEVTESAMMSDPDVALRTLTAFHDMGITLSIDDFGTGYSSLAYLKKLPVSELKIDKSFVLNMAEDQQDRKIVQSIIDLSHNLGMSVVAEGIENQQSLDMLVGMGCDFGQGFYIGRPMPVGDLPPWVEETDWCRSEEKIL